MGLTDWRADGDSQCMKAIELKTIFFNKNGVLIPLRSNPMRNLRKTKENDQDRPVPTKKNVARVKFSGVSLKKNVSESRKNKKSAKLSGRKINKVETSNRKKSNNKSNSK